MSDILIIGGSGQLGTELRYLLDEKKIKYDAPSSALLNITDLENTSIYIRKMNPKYIFHCAAYTAVDNAEDIGKELNWQINAIGTENVSIIAEELGAAIIYLSTDYIFDGLNEAEYKTIDIPNPKNEYGKAKLYGELAVKKNCSKYFIVRTSWVFGEFGKNFVLTMLNLAENRSSLSVVSDQIGRPTWTRTIAEFLLYILDNDLEFGIYHLSNDNSCSWYEFAQEILKDKNIEILPVTSEEYPQKAFRPKHSVMNLQKVKNTGFYIPTWQVSLENLKNKLEEA